MHSTLFAMKRVYFQSIKVTRAQLKKYNLTPARFDVLHAIYNHRARECFRVDLVRCIGTVKSNIWRLCDAIEELGLAYTDWDGFRIIHLTNAGIALVEKILEEALDTIDELLDKAATDVGTGTVEERRATLAIMLRDLRTNLRDRHALDVYHPNLEQRMYEMFVLPRARRYWLGERVRMVAA